MTTWYKDYETKRKDAMEILVQRPLYNVDFQDAKDTLNRAFESAYDAEVAAPFFHCGRYERRPEAVNELTYSDWSLHRLPGLTKKVNACKANDPALTAMKLLLNSWEVAHKVLTAAKRDAIKGRKPSDKPRKTPERTLENTGTCAVCGQNVKLKEGKIVDHGFRLAWGQRQGICLGVGKYPWEVSPAGKILYAEIVERELEYLHQQKEDLQVEPDADPVEVHRELARIESEIRFGTKTLELLRKEIDNWKPQPLPGARYEKA